MGGSFRLILMVFALIAVTGCSEIQRKVKMAGVIAQVAQPGHRYRDFVALTNSMAPTINRRDNMLVDITAYDASRPMRGDIVRFAPPIPSQIQFVSRVLGVPGDTVSIHRGQILINGKPMPASYPPKYEFAIAHYQLLVNGSPMETEVADLPARPRWSAPNRLPAGCYFLLGDNVNNSEDSHIWGCAELSGHFTSGLRKGDAVGAVGKVVRAVP
jgi:signal peptidase I